jgi:RNase P/RNase MRP subunit POP5
MPKRSPGERWRYIAFGIEASRSFTRGDFLNALLQKSRHRPLDDSFRITVFEGDFGILKVPHKLKDEAIDALASVDSIADMPCRVIPLKTSGTIKTLKARYRDLIKRVE